MIDNNAYGVNNLGQTIPHPVSLSFQDRLPMKIRINNQRSCLRQMCSFPVIKEKIAE